MVVIFPIETPAQRQVLGVAIAFSILAVVAVCLRLLAHHLARKRWILTDYFIIAAGIFAVGLQSISITGVIQAGIGYGHVNTIAGTFGTEPIIKLLQLIIPLQFLWVLSLSCTKISILFLYLSIFPVTWVVRVSWATMALIVGWTIGTILAGCLICRPFAFNWDQTIPGGSCGNQVTSFKVTGIINLITDVVVLVTPMPLLYKLQMATYKKVTFITIFGLGAVTCIISILRISVLSTMDFTDITYSIPRANIFSGLEPCLAVILASVPMMRPLLGRLRYTPEVTARPPNKSPSPSGRSGSTGDGEFQPLQNNSSELCLRPIGPKHEVGVAVQSPTEARDISRGNEASLEAGKSRDTDQREKRGLGISVKQEWAVLHGRGHPIVIRSFRCFGYCSFHSHYLIICTMYIVSDLHGFSFQDLVYHNISFVQNYLLQETFPKISSVIYRMLFRYLLALVIQLCWVDLGLAQDATITIPWVTDAPDYFHGYGGKVIGAKDATTTYGINCLSDQRACHRFTPDLTVIYGPSTYDMIANGYKFDFTSGCTLMGSPTPTGASCTETKSLHEASTTTSATVLVPATGDDSTLGIFPATLIVTDTGDFPAPSTATEDRPLTDSHVSTTDSSLTAPATATTDPISVASVGFLNSTAMITGGPTYFGNGTSQGSKNGTTVTVTVLASSIPCHCECDCGQHQTAKATVTVPMAMKNHGVNTAAPVALIYGIVAGAMFWI
ncbi:unnamed protein product [Penicillium egyptiacum]|uniref:Rhodopsin domain-containing protein n=1 Tax=Penicillium egyptiacum TaxID=1303716 RepID=A0A9W4KET3_9EURO|nr:unnamed protein product [Penicillium egyptiacum]